MSTLKIDTSREAVMRLINDMWERCRRAEARAAERMLTALLARAEAAEAEVVRSRDYFGRAMLICMGLAFLGALLIGEVAK